MSRTIVHLPYRVVCLTEPSARIWHDHRRSDCCVETLTDWRERYEYTRGKRYGYSVMPCTPELPWREIERYCGRGVSGDYVRLNWMKPARQRVRLGLRTVLREYNTDGEIDTEIEPHMSRRQSYWAW